MERQAATEFLTFYFKKYPAMPFFACAYEMTDG